MISLLEIAIDINEDKMKLKPKGGGKVVVFKNKDNYEKALKSGDYEEPEGSKKVKRKGSDMDFDRDGSEDDNNKSDDVEISDANSGPIDREDIMDMLKNDPEIMDKIGTGDDDDLYWDGMDLVSSKFDDDTIASIPNNANMTLGDLKKQIMDYEEDMDETKTINGVKYKPIKESKQHILKENYERFFGDKKWNN